MKKLTTVNMGINYLRRTAWVIVALISCQTVLAREEADVEYSFIIPYLDGEVIEFDGGAEASIESDIGFGFGVSGFYSDQMAGRMDFLWNSSSYAATRVLDDGNQTEELFAGSFDSFSLLFGGDYYLTRSKLAPFVSANFGYTYIDSNIPANAPVSACWWDPWYGYICDSYIPTYAKDTWSYGVGAGIRFDVSDRHFIKFGYYEEWIDIDRAKGSPGIGVFKLEFGGKLY